jgi:hypothetical protein
MVSSFFPGVRTEKVDISLINDTTRQHHITSQRIVRQRTYTLSTGHFAAALPPPLSSRLCYLSGDSPWKKKPLSSTRVIENGSCSPTHKKKVQLPQAVGG